MSKLSHQLPILLAAVLLAACSSEVTTKSQMIVCDTDPDSGTILRCEPGDEGGEDTCVDVDEDGDGQPSDDTDGQVLSYGGSPDDGDGDGVPDADDCDEHPGEVDLPYAIEPQLGDTVTPIRDAFAEKGAQPHAIVAVEMEDGGTWRLAELTGDVAFTVTNADCNHVGNRDVGRDRVFVTWQNVDGSTETDHLDIRYCD
ncbi:MAG: hypothetical protein H0T89_34515 [Deltaproteobacteria bacterium]|nr:hypothetical protein [Deltaproteobacteria bacterium]MDQ3297009.1 hypothetical protein [Myxococcota bacterium]